MIRGERGTAKSTAARALAALLPRVKVIDDCRFGCDPDKPNTWCTECKERFTGASKIPYHVRTTSFVNLPVSATEDRVVDDSVITFEIAAEGFMPLPLGTHCEMRLTHIFEMRDGKIAKEIGIEGPPRAL